MATVLNRRSPAALVGAVVELLEHRTLFSVATASELISSSPTTSYGSAVTFADDVTAASGATAPTPGSVDFADTTTGLDLGNGIFQSSSAATSIWALTTSPGELNVTNASGDVITATYSPGPGFVGSSGSETEVVVPEPTSLAVLGLVGVGVLAGRRRTSPLSGLKERTRQERTKCDASEWHLLKLQPP